MLKKNKKNEKLELAKIEKKELSVKNSLTEEISDAIKDGIKDAINDGINDDRKEMILKSIIKTYLDTGEPVGSRTLSKILKVKLSPATIRNEMADLEEEGYIEQLHTSGGRIPTTKGYRYYVDNLLLEKNIEMKNLKTEMFERVDKLENMLKNLVQVVASNTNYPALIKGPSVIDNKIKYIQLSNLETNKILAVMVAEGNIIKTFIIDLEKEIKAKDIINISITLNNLVTGRKINDLFLDEFSKEIKSIKEKSIESTIEKIIKSIRNTLKEEKPENQIYTFGADKFFKYKEFVDNDNVKQLIGAFENKNELRELVDEISNEDNTAIKVYIGDEAPVDSMKDCSVVSLKCDFGNGMKGTIGVVGPKRMDYEKVINTLKNVMTTANKELNK